jgi:putative FmdB family regulatory protein
MPIYEYLCQDCGKKFEGRGSEATETSELECPGCGQKHLQQEYSTFAAHANGSPKSADMPSCPGGQCSNPGMCGMN